MRMEVGKAQRERKSNNRPGWSRQVETKSRLVVMFQGKEGQKYQSRSRSGKEEKRGRRCMAG